MPSFFADVRPLYLDYKSSEKNVFIYSSKIIKVIGVTGGVLLDIWPLMSFFSHISVKIPVKDMPPKCSRKGDSRRKKYLYRNMSLQTHIMLMSAFIYRCPPSFIDVHLPNKSYIIKRVQYGECLPFSPMFVPCISNTNLPKNFVFIYWKN